MEIEEKDLVQKADELYKCGEYASALENFEYIWNKSDKNNNYILWKYGLSLRKNNKADVFVRIIRESDRNESYLDDKRIESAFCWCLYDSSIKNYFYDEEKPDSFDNFLKDAKYIIVHSEQKSAKESYLTPYVFTVKKVIKEFLKRSTPNYKEILNWLDFLHPEELSEDPFPFTDGKGKERELASPKEFYYQNKIKALEKTGQYEACYKLCEECLEKITRFHYKNDIWVEARKWYCKCMIDSQNINDFIEFAEKRRIWHIYSKLSEICFRYKRLDDAIIYGCKSILCGFEYEKMVKLYLTLAQLFDNMGLNINAKKMYHAAAYYRSFNVWNIPQELEYAIEKYGIDKTQKVNKIEIEKIAREYLKDKGIIEVGQVTKILKDKGCGFIRISSQKDEIYFKIKDSLSRDIAVNNHVFFEVIDYGDKKRAINISTYKGGINNGSLR